MSAKIAQKDLETWADYLIEHSIGGVAPGEVVMIKGERITWPLMSLLQDRVLSRGGIPDVNLVAPDNDRGKVWGAAMGRHGSTELIARVPSWHLQRYEAMDKYIEVLGAECPEFFGGQKEDLAQAIMRADERPKETRLLKRWVITLYPTEAFAALEELGLEEYAEVIVSASTMDPRELEAVEEPIADLMHRSDDIRIETHCPETGKDLLLQMDISSRNVIKCTGKRNFPDGEVFTSPDARSVEGEIFVDMPVFYSGETIEGVYLRFEGGVICEYKAQRGGGALAKIIETDGGSHRLGEVALGMNAGIKKVLRHPLFVEKVGGTLHIAIGASYPECYVDDPSSDEGRAACERLFQEGLLNRSAQHVDIVTDFRPGGAGRAVYLGGQRIEVRGNVWVVPD